MKCIKISKKITKGWAFERLSLFQDQSCNMINLVTFNLGDLLYAEVHNHLNSLANN